MDLESHHGASLATYMGIFFALLVLTGTTVLVAFEDFGVLNTPIALAIASLKATLVILFFMHVKWSERLVALFAFSGFVWLLILIGFVLADVGTRGWISPTG
jgi:cytochrome c oxidase subunit 4